MKIKNYTIKGKVIRGDNYGNKIGFPTLNLDRRNYLTLIDKPIFGIYAGIVEIDSKKYKSGIVIGPLDKNNLPKIEAHLIGYKDNAYGKKAIFFLNKYLRKYKKFKSEQELIIQIKKDIKQCK